MSDVDDNNANNKTNDGDMDHDEFIKQNTKSEDELVFDELGNIYLLEDVLTNILVAYKRCSD